MKTPDHFKRKREEAFWERARTLVCEEVPSGACACGGTIRIVRMGGGKSEVSCETCENEGSITAWKWVGDPEPPVRPS